MCLMMCSFNTCTPLQIDNLKDFSLRIGNSRHGSMFKMVGGYTIANKHGLARLSAALKMLGNHDSLRDLIRVGVHSDVQVTSHSWGTKLIPPLTALDAESASASGESHTEFPTIKSAVDPSLVAAAASTGSVATAPSAVHSVTQVFCSAVACNYNKTTSRSDWLVGTPASL